MEQKRNLRRILIAVVIVMITVLVVFAMLPSPQLVETGRVERGPLRVTIDQEGETRAHDRFIVSAPVLGRLMRVALEEGDAVTQAQVVARIDPLPLNQRERQEVLARVDAAEAALRQARAREAHARHDSEQSHRDRQRAEQLARDGVISSQSLEEARNADSTAQAELDAARSSIDVAASEVMVAKAGLVGLNADPDKPPPIIELRAPVSSRVLRVLEKSERVVQAGTPIMALGDPAKLEVVADVLSTDAVKIRSGAPVLLVGWGGNHAIRARVRLVEPGGFTKISALGVEEKRVNVISDFVDPPGPLGDGYRVETQIEIWSGSSVLHAPLSAVFRRGQGWSTFVIKDGHASERDLEIEHRTETEVEILKGLSEGEKVIVHPSNQVRDGMRVRTE